MLAILGLGFVLGVRHALDADHVAAVSTLATRTRSVRASSLAGAVWGLGHTLALMGVFRRPELDLRPVLDLVLLVLGGALGSGLAARFRRAPAGLGLLLGGAAAVAAGPSRDGFTSNSASRRPTPASPWR